jgi:hypothetical protein
MPLETVSVCEDAPVYYAMFSDNCSLASSCRKC